MALLSFGAAAQTTSGNTASGITTALCGIVAIIADVIGVLAILMFVLGGTLYGFAHFMPASGNMKGSMQGWGMGILMGSIVMLMLYLLAPFIISRLIAASQGPGSTLPARQSIGCTSTGQAIGGTPVVSSSTPQPGSGTSTPSGSGTVIT